MADCWVARTAGYWADLKVDPRAGPMADLTVETSADSKAVQTAAMMAGYLVGYWADLKECLLVVQTAD